jgi:hypothetical protein
MQLTVFLLLLWAALTAGCYFPFNDPRLANETLLADFLANAGVVDNGGSAYLTTIEKGSLRQTWPARGSPPITFVPFCYHGQGCKYKLKGRSKSLIAFLGCISVTCTNHGFTKSRKLGPFG